ncbi:DNA (cytosine-5)-methyltransferase 3B [Frankliniella fusca]|uniref:DNA (Cytosine-5)-methyltransferase 3B n=1 Tax=Frankliniella fusca TaxID=407009 RepID=A0AAE1HD39_9NEOP|nr:DNA (cytosine-5)-methyltransferase 3B [Frankliniella fusca]KAK3918991.1 DNA (cytosine-5)-methyltransferase 3B [Frankliniella fusca]
MWVYKVAPRKRKTFTLQRDYQRQRWLWESMGGKSLVTPRGLISAFSKNHQLQDFLEPYRIAAVKCRPTLTTNSHSQCNRKEQYPALEALFGLPTHYTDACNLSITDRKKLLGRAWCVPLIIQILKPLAEELSRL